MAISIRGCVVHKLVFETSTPLASELRRATGWVFIVSQSPTLPQSVEAWFVTPAALRSGVPGPFRADMEKVTRTPTQGQIGGNTATHG